jgi:hypothetical protein
LQDIKTIDYAPATNDKRQPSSLTIDIITTDREYSFLAISLDEKKEFLTTLRKVCIKDTDIFLSFKFYLD